MGFEKKMLDAVKDVADGAYFYCGTMCLPNVSEDTALVVLDTLKQNVICDVKMTLVADEYLYDFVPLREPVSG